jgi:hypothetical protein
MINWDRERGGISPSFLKPIKQKRKKTYKK